MKTTAVLLLATGTCGAGFLAGWLFHCDGTCKIEALPAPTSCVESVHLANPESPPELERPDSRMVIIPAPVPQPGEANPIGDLAGRGPESDLDQVSRLTLTPVRELVEQARTLQLTPPDPRNLPEPMKEAALLDPLNQLTEAMQRLESARAR